MATKKTYDTVSEATTQLRKRGYTLDFLHYANTHNKAENGDYIPLSASQFKIDEVHRFEGQTDPGDEMIVYAISSVDGLKKGVILNAFGPYANAQKSLLVSELERG